MITAIDVVRGGDSAVYVAVHPEGRLLAWSAGSDERRCLEQLREQVGAELRVVPRLAKSARWLGLQPGRISPRALEAVRLAPWLHLAGVRVTPDVGVEVLRAFLRNVASAWRAELWVQRDLRRLPISLLRSLGKSEREQRFLATVQPPSVADGGQVELVREDGFSFTIGFRDDGGTLTSVLRRFALAVVPSPARIDGEPLDTGDLLTLCATLDVLAQVAEREPGDDPGLAGSTCGIGDECISASAWIGGSEPAWVQ